MTPRKIEPSAIIPLPQYAGERAERRKRITELKKNRRLEVGVRMRDRAAFPSTYFVGVKVEAGSAHSEWRGDGRHVRETSGRSPRAGSARCVRQIEPRGLPGYRIGVGNPAAGFQRP